MEIVRDLHLALQSLLAQYDADAGMPGLDNPVGMRVRANAVAALENSAAWMSLPAWRRDGQERRP